MSRRRKKTVESAGSPWITTFADLMNLLLCFFVLLFSMSSVDAEKYEQLLKSMNINFSVYSSGAAAIEDGRMISSGIKQLDDLNEYRYESGNNEKNETDSLDEMDFDQELLEKNIEESKEIYEQVAKAAQSSNIYDYLDLTIDPNYQYVKIALDGFILFDSGKADIKKEAYTLLDRLGDILKEYNTEHIIEIEGHTDNVPIVKSVYSSNEMLSSARAINAASYLIEEKKLDPKMLKWTGRGEYDPITSNSTAEGRSKNRRIEVKIYNNIS